MLIDISKRRRKTMNSQKSTPEEIVKKSIELTDLLSELDVLIEKIQVLSGDVCDNHIEKINFKTERGKLNAEYDFDIIKVMMDVLCNYIAEASEVSRKVPKLSSDIYESLLKC